MWQIVALKRVAVEIPVQLRKEKELLSKLRNAKRFLGKIKLLFWWEIQQDR